MRRRWDKWVAEVVIYEQSAVHSGTQWASSEFELFSECTLLISAYEYLFAASLVIALYATCLTFFSQEVSTQNLITWFCGPHTSGLKNMCYGPPPPSLSHSEKNNDTCTCMWFPTGTRSVFTITHKKKKVWLFPGGNKCANFYSFILRKIPYLFCILDRARTSMLLFEETQGPEFGYWYLTRKTANKIIIHKNHMCTTLTPFTHNDTK